MALAPEKWQAAALQEQPSLPPDACHSPPEVVVAKENGRLLINYIQKNKTFVKALA